MSVEEILAAANTPAESRRADRLRKRTTSPMPQPQQYMPHMQ